MAIGDVRTEERSSAWLRREQEIVDVAAQLFARKGYHATAVADLCEAVGVGKGALYHYIESKEQLLLRIHDTTMNALLARATQTEKDYPDPIERLRRLGQDLVETIGQYPDHAWVFHELRTLDKKHEPAFRAPRDEFEEIVGRALDDGTRAGTIEIPDRRLALLAWMGLYNYTYQWYRPEGPRRPEEIAEVYFQIFVNGVSPRSSNDGSR